MSTAGTPRIDIYGVQFDTLDMPDVIRHIIEQRSRGAGGWVTTPNVDIVRQASDDPALARLVAGAPLVVLDGAPVSLAGRIAGRPPVPRVPGASLVGPLASAAADVGAPVLLLGGRPGASERAAAGLAATIPGLRIAEHCPPYGFDEDLEQWARVVSAVGECDGGIVFCGFGFPKQERLMAEMSLLFPGTWFLGVGAAIDFLAGEVPRAPRWVQRAGFEWAFRLVVEPRRLARRYLVEGMPFAAQLLGWAIRQRMGSGRLEQVGASVAAQGVGPAAESNSSERARPLAAEHIDLDRRVVTVRAGDDADRTIELTFQQYRAAVATGRLAQPADEALDGGAEVATIDLRDEAVVVPHPRRPQRGTRRAGSRPW